MEIITSQIYMFIHDEGYPWLLDPNSSLTYHQRLGSDNDDHTRKEEALSTNGKNFDTIFLYSFLH